MKGFLSVNYLWYMPNSPPKVDIMCIPPAAAWGALLCIAKICAFHSDFVLGP